MSILSRGVHHDQSTSPPPARLSAQQQPEMRQTANVQEPEPGMLLATSSIYSGDDAAMPTPPAILRGSDLRLARGSAASFSIEDNRLSAGARFMYWIATR